MWSDNEASIDLLRFKSLASTVTQVIREEALLPTTIGVFGDWGSGKSTLLKMVEEELQATNSLMCLTFNGWLFEGYEDAKTALMGSILDAIEERVQGDENLVQKSGKLIKKLLGRVSWMQVLGLVSKYGLPMLLGMPQFAALSGISDMIKSEPVNPDDVAKLLNLTPKELQEIRRDIRDFRKDFKELLDQTEIRTLVVFIDDLDRCLPDTVIATLEAIRLFLFVPKTVFILGADERLVEYAVRNRFPALPGTEREVGRDYLEKLVQIPIRIPPLSGSEIESYMNLLFAQKFLNAEEYKSMCDELSKAEVADALARMFDVESARRLLSAEKVSELEADLDLNAQIVPILSPGLGGNPRRTKRFLNTLILRMSLSKARGLKLEKRVLVKLMILEYMKPVFFKELANLQIQQEGKPRELVAAETQLMGIADDTKESNVPENNGKSTSTKSKAKEKSVIDSKVTKEEESAQLQTWLADEWMLRWLKLQPLLAGTDLRPYFYIAHDNVGALGASQLRLSHKAQEVLNRLTSNQAFARRAGVNEIASLSDPDVNAIFQRLTEQIRQTDGSASTSIEKTLADMTEKKKELVPQYIAFYEALPELRITPAIPPTLVRLSANTSAETATRTLIQRWAKSTHTLLAQSAQQMLNREN
jgi:predicted KAP-like P-loop ATPase